MTAQMIMGLMLDEPTRQRFFRRMLLPPNNQEEEELGLVFAKITLINEFDQELVDLGTKKIEEVRSVQVEALVDSGAITTVIPKAIQEQLGLKVREERQYELADGKALTLPVVGGLKIVFENRIARSSAVVMGDDVLLGVTALEEMDIMIDPLNNRLVVNPQNPNMARLKLK